MSGRFNPRPPSGERPHGRPEPVGGYGVSIHAPRVGSDAEAERGLAEAIGFNPRPPSGERRYANPAPIVRTLVSIHAPRVGSDPCDLSSGHSVYVSIHAPRVGSDTAWYTLYGKQKSFNPRPPSGERPKQGIPVGYLSIVSIHAPRVGSDHFYLLGSSFYYSFNPRPPSGERPGYSEQQANNILRFNPRPPSGERPITFQN